MAFCKSNLQSKVMKKPWIASASLNIDPIMDPGKLWFGLITE